MANKAQVKLKFYDGYGENFKALREKEGLTLSELGEQLFYSDKTISMIENESRLPTIEQLNRYIEKFDVSIDYLTGRTKAMTSDLQMICEYTGLSEAAVRKLHEISFETSLGYYQEVHGITSFVERPERNSEALNIISLIISDEFFLDLILNILNLDKRHIVPNRSIDFVDYENAKEQLKNTSGEVLRKGGFYIISENEYYKNTQENIRAEFGEIVKNILTRNISEKDLIKEEIEQTKIKLKELKEKEKNLG